MELAGFIEEEKLGRMTSLALIPLAMTSLALSLATSLETTRVLMVINDEKMEFLVTITQCYSHSYSDAQVILPGIYSQLPKSGVSP